MATCESQAPAESHIPLRVDKNRMARRHRSQGRCDLSLRIAHNWNVSASHKAHGRGGRPGGGDQVGGDQFDKDSVAVSPGSGQ